jgi:hypothetical protein
MKKLAAAACALLLSAAAFAAEPVLIVTSKDESTEYYAHPDTFAYGSSGYSMTITALDKTEGVADSLVQIKIAVTFFDCAQGEGSLYTRLTDDAQWERAGAVSIKNRTSVADELASTLCNVGQMLSEQDIDL